MEEVTLAEFVDKRSLQLSFKLNLKLQLFIEFLEREIAQVRLNILVLPVMGLAGSEAYDLDVQEFLIMLSRQGVIKNFRTPIKARMKGDAIMAILYCKFYQTEEEMRSELGARNTEVYESKLEVAAQELKTMEEDIYQEKDMDIPYRTAFDKSMAMLKNPYSVWEKLDVLEQQRLFFFIFEQKLEYSKTEGYRTAKSLSTKRLFEGFAGENNLDVEVGNLTSRPNPALRASLRRVVSIGVSEEE